MAAFIAKQIMGDQLSAVKEISVGDNLSPEEKERLAQLEKERLEALREQEERRREKHRKMEEEREKIRKGIREKYNIKKKEEQTMSMDRDGERQDSINSQMNMKPGEGMSDEDDEFTKLKTTIEQRINDFKTTIESRCIIH